MSPSTSRLTVAVALLALVVLTGCRHGQERQAGPAAEEGAAGVGVMDAEWRCDAPPPALVGIRATHGDE